MLSLLALVCAAPALAQPPKLPAGADPKNTLVIDTTKGRIIIKLRTDLAPHHAERLKQLARDGYYNNVPFHRVMDGFMAQTGDGQNFNGTGHSKYPNITAEFTPHAVHPRRRRHGARVRSEFGQFAVLHLLCRCVVPERPIYRDRQRDLGHGCGRQAQESAARLAAAARSTNPDKMVKVQVAADMK